MSQAKSSVSLSHHLANTNTNAFLWDSNVPQTSLSRPWRIRDVEDTGVYLNNIGAFSFTQEHHIVLLDKILHRLDANGFTVNPLKCEWAIQETDWLGYWLTPTGLKPWHKKIDGILQMQKPKNLFQMRDFLGAVNHYQQMWPQRTHILAPLSSMSGKNFNGPPTRILPSNA